MARLLVTHGYRLLECVAVMVTERGFLMEVEVGGLSNLSEVVVCGEVE